jgi:hypothetical protein
VVVEVEYVVVVEAERVVGLEDAVCVGVASIGVTVGGTRGVVGGGISGIDTDELVSGVSDSDGGSTNTSKALALSRSLAGISAPALPSLLASELATTPSTRR